ncbi:helix-turn-helix domain-containing protein [Myxococcus sp. K38C18041901]|uniref:helix-turn-helix domain-containing protein n=1 Tax=Myxococcus guangdongensis TaxID=2906760 RepID=UPI0020A826B0|nr:helix-turn-helix domain-containing protein [Myxococcus guangdongensis]MCP3060062.1 helix-turn-helix domain-containing protein [Myxococcus guangdongensis]
MKPFAQQTYYELLEVPVTAPMEEIRAAYSRLMELYAPDSIAVYALVEPDQVDALRARMTEAMEILTDVDLRGEYDRDLGLPAPWGTVKAPEAGVVARAAEALASAVEEGKKREPEEEAPALSGPEAFRASFVSGYSLSYVTSSLQSVPLVGGLVDVPASLSVGAEAQASSSATEAVSSGSKAVSTVEQGAAQSVPRQEHVSAAEQARVAAVPVPPEVSPSVESAPVAAPPVAVAPSAPVVSAPAVAAAPVEPAPVAAPVVSAPVVVAPPVVATPVASAPPMEQVPVAAPVAAAPPVELNPVAAPVASAPPVDPSPATPASVAPVISAPLPVAASPDVPASVPTQPSEPVTSIVVAQAPSRTPEPASTPVTRPVGPAAPPPVSSSQNRVSAGRQLSEAQVLAQDSAIATAEAALAQVAARTREPRPRLPDIPADAEFNGELLRRVRETRGYTLQQVADRTRISSRHLENVEADRYTALPAQVYLRGILMNLARELGLDPLRVSRSYLGLASEKSGKK